MPVNVLETTQTIRLADIEAYREQPGFLDHVDHTAMRCMAEALRPFVAISEPPPDMNLGVQMRRYSIAVGDMREQDKFNAAVEARAKELCAERFAEAAAKAIKNVQNWGSYYGIATISKNDATRLINEAFLQPVT